MTHKNSQQIILVSKPSRDSSLIPESNYSILSDEVVAVAVIIATAYFSKVLLASIKDLISAFVKPRKK